MKANRLYLLMACLLAFYPSVQILAAELPARLMPADRLRLQEMLTNLSQDFGVPEEKFSDIAILNGARGLLESGFFQLQGKELYIWISAKSGTPIVGGSRKERTLTHQESLEFTKHSPPPPRMTEAEALLTAKLFSVRLGAKLDESYRFWNAPNWSPLREYHAPSKSWTFSWSRFVGDVPVYNDRILIRIFDETGKLASFNNYIRQATYAPIQLKLSVADAMQTAAAHETWRVKTEEDPKWHTLKYLAYPDPKLVRLCYYWQENFGLIGEHARTPPRLRLVYEVLVGHYPDNDPAKSFHLDTSFFVDAVDGEIVPLNREYY